MVTHNIKDVRRPEAAAEKMASFQTLDYLSREAALGNRQDFEQFLERVPDVPAQAGDEFSTDSDN